MYEENTLLVQQVRQMATGGNIHTVEVLIGSYRASLMLLEDCDDCEVQEYEQHKARAEQKMFDFLRKG